MSSSCKYWCLTIGSKCYRESKSTCPLSASYLKGVKTRIRIEITVCVVQGVISIAMLVLAYKLYSVSFISASSYDRLAL